MKQNTAERVEKALTRVSSGETSGEAYRLLVQEAKELFGAKDGAIILLQNDSLEKAYESSSLSLENHHKKMRQISTVLFEESHVFVPLPTNNQLMGVLVLELRKETVLSTDDKVLLTMYGTLAALLLENMNLKEARTKALTDFMAYASHELRNPLTSLHGYIQLLHRKRPTEGKEAQWIEDLYQESTKFIALVKDIFDTKKLK